MKTVTISLFIMDGIHFVGESKEDFMQEHSHLPHYDFAEGFVPRSLHTIEEIEKNPLFNVHLNSSCDEFYKVFVGKASELQRFFDDCDAML